MCGIPLQCITNQTSLETSVVGNRCYIFFGLSRVKIEIQSEFLTLQELERTTEVGCNPVQVRLTYNTLLVDRADRETVFAILVTTTYRGIVVLGDSCTENCIKSINIVAIITTGLAVL